jgi:hypothetical protein
MRSLVSDLSSRNATCIGRALCWALPWSRRGYPGFHRGVTEILSRWITPTAVQHWRCGRRRMSVPDACRLRQYLVARITEGQNIVAELDDYIAARGREPRRLVGCCAPHASSEQRAKWRG